MSSLEAAMQTLVTQSTIASAVAGELMQHSRNLLGDHIGRHLVLMGKVGTGQLIA